MALTRTVVKRDGQDLVGVVGPVGAHHRPPLKHGGIDEVLIVARIPALGAPAGVARPCRLDRTLRRESGRDQTPIGLERGHDNTLDLAVVVVGAQPHRLSGEGAVGELLGVVGRQRASLLDQRHPRGKAELLAVGRIDRHTAALRRDMATDRLDDGRFEERLKRPGRDFGVIGQTPFAGLSQDVAEVVQQAGEHHLVTGVVGRGEGGGLERVVEHRHPLAVRPGRGGGQEVEQHIDERDLPAQQR